MDNAWTSLLTGRTARKGRAARNVLHATHPLGNTGWGFGCHSKPFLALNQRTARCSARGEDERRAELARWRRLLLWSIGLTLPVFLTAMVLPMLPAFRPLLKAQVRKRHFMIDCMCEAEHVCHYPCGAHVANGCARFPGRKRSGGGRTQGCRSAFAALVPHEDGSMTCVWV